MLKIIVTVILGYVLLYTTIYIHEVGHALIFWTYGCKNNPLKVSVNPSLFGSTPAPLLDDEVAKLSKWRYILCCYGGILMNALFGAVLFIPVCMLHTDNYYVLLILYMAVTLHLSEIVTYMVIGNVYLVSDMQGIAANEKRLRIPNFVVGLLILVFYVYIFTRMPSTVFGPTLVVNVVTILCMGIGRVVFTMAYQKTQNNN